MTLEKIYITTDLSACFQVAPLLCGWHDPRLQNIDVEGILTWPAPPVASMVTGATKRVILRCLWSKMSAPKQC